MPEAHESHIQPVPEAHISIPLSLIRIARQLGCPVSDGKDVRSLRE
jgi:hypothetical protein